MSRTILGVAAAALALAACGGDDDDASDSAAEESAAADDDADEQADAATDESTAETSDDAATGEPAADDAAGNDDSAGDEPEAAEPAGGDNIATVTLDGTTYEVDVSLGLTPTCNPDFFAAFLATGGDAESLFYALLPPPDDPNHSDPPNVKLNLNNGEFEWIADPSKQMSGVEEGDSQVDEFSIDGNTASGTATFVELNETYAHSGGGPEPQPVTGTFQITCAG